MKKKQLPIKNAFRILSFIFAAILISACSKKVVFPTSEVVPAANAVVQVEKKDYNYQVKLEVENLADPGRLTPSRNYYTAWMVTKKHGTINIGNLKVSRKNKVSLETMTPYEPIRIFITAEDDSRAVLPSTQVVLDSEEFKV
ncbi:hypothetical protein [Salinimicrobium flavum]|uniref:Uncharacterized protein n=1 Tax=Salinimicrobium flavum TaxID=1737065 RepID=A0ABW5ITU3_9FLAO